MCIFEPIALGSLYSQRTETRIFRMWFTWTILGTHCGMSSSTLQQCCFSPSMAKGVLAGPGFRRNYNHSFCVQPIWILLGARLSFVKLISPPIRPSNILGIYCACKYSKTSTISSSFILFNTFLLFTPIYSFSKRRITDQLSLPCVTEPSKFLQTIEILLWGCLGNSKYENDV